MEKLSEKIDITLENSEVLKRKISFENRWNMQDEDNNRLAFRNRSLNVIEEELSTFTSLSTRGDIISDLSIYIEFQMGFSQMGTLCYSFSESGLGKYLLTLDLSIDEKFHKFLFAIECVMNYYGNYFDNVSIAKKMAESLKLSNINAVIYKEGKNYLLFPTNVEFLDNKLVFDVLSWMSDYESSKEKFCLAIKEERVPEKYRSIVDNLRLSLELFFKQIFNNNKSLENQIANIGAYLQKNKVSVEIRNMYVKLLDYYCIYNNDKAKHDDKVVEIEIDYMIYLTGSFIRMFIKIEKEKQRIS